jgi:hypothetical protein
MKHTIVAKRRLATRWDTYMKKEFRPAWAALIFPFVYPSVRERPVRFELYDETGKLIKKREVN